MLISVTEACRGGLVGHFSFDDKNADNTIDSRYLAVFRDHAAEMLCDDNETVVSGIISAKIVIEWIENRREMIETFEFEMMKEERCRRIDLKRLRQFLVLLKASEDWLERGNLAGLLFRYG